METILKKICIHFSNNKLWINLPEHDYNNLFNNIPRGKTKINYCYEEQLISNTFVLNTILVDWDKVEYIDFMTYWPDIPLTIED